MSDGDGGDLDWTDFSAVWQSDLRPEDVEAAFERGESTVGVAVIALALNHPAAAPVFPLVAMALEAPCPQLREQGVVAMAHLARLHHAVDRRCLALLRSFGRGNAADDDLWTFIPHRKLPLWLWRHHTRERLAWWVRDRWRG